MALTDYINHVEYINNKRVYNKFSLCTLSVHRVCSFTMHKRARICCVFSIIIIVCYLKSISLIIFCTKESNNFRSICKRFLFFMRLFKTKTTDLLFKLNISKLFKKFRITVGLSVLTFIMSCLSLLECTLDEVPF